MRIQSYNVLFETLDSPLNYALSYQVIQLFSQYDHIILEGEAKPHAHFLLMSPMGTYQNRTHCKYSIKMC